LGYGYVVLDDCWSDGRDSKGKLIVDKKKFPRGMASVADDLHAQGFLFGMYSSAGELTCARYGKLRPISHPKFANSEIEIISDTV
jgi:alpha-galactosidase